MAGRAFSHLAFAVAALAAGYAALGVFLGNMPAGVSAAAFGVALALFAAGAFARNPGAVQRRRPPVEIIQPTGEVPAARKPRVPIADRPLERKPGPLSILGLPVVQVGLVICAIGVVLKLVLNHDPPILAFCVALAGAVVAFLGWVEGR